MMIIKEHISEIHPCVADELCDNKRTPKKKRGKRKKSKKSPIKLAISETMANGPTFAVCEDTAFRSVSFFSPFSGRSAQITA